MERHRDRRAAGLVPLADQEALAVRRRQVAESRRVPEGQDAGKQRARRAEGERTGDALDGDRCQRAVLRPVEELPPVASPARHITAAGRHLPERSARRDRLQEDLAMPGERRGIGEIAPVGRELGAIVHLWRAREGDRLRAIGERQEPELGVPVVAVDQVAPVGRPVPEKDLAFARVERLLGAGAIQASTADLVPPLAGAILGRVGELGAVGRPDRKGPAGSVAEGESRGCAAGHRLQPDVPAHGVVTMPVGQGPVVGGELETAQGEPAGQRRDRPPCAVEPADDFAFDGELGMDENAVRCDRERAVPGVAGGTDPQAERKRLADRAETFGVESPRRQETLAAGEQIAGAVRCRRGGVERILRPVEHAQRRRAVEIADVHASLRGRSREAHEEETASVRQELRVAVLARRGRTNDPGKRDRLAAPVADPEESLFAEAIAEDDRAVGRPGAAAGVRRVAELLDGTAVAGDAAQLVVREEAERAAVGGEERIGRAAGSSERACLEGVERAHPDLSLGDDGEEAAVRGELEVVGIDTAAGARSRPVQLEAHRGDGGRGRLAADEPGEERDGERDCHGRRACGDNPGQPRRLRPGGDRRRLGVARGSGSDLLQHDARIGDVVQAVLRIALEAAAQELADRRRRLRGQPRKIDLRLEHSGEGLGDAVAAEQRAAGEHLVEHYAERPDVRPLVDRLSLRLLRRHVGRRAENHAQLRAVDRGEGWRIHDRWRARQVRRGSGTGGRLHRLGQPEIEDLGLSLTGSFYVLGLEIAVDDPFLVRLFERLRDLQRERKALSKGKRPLFEALGERRTGDELHDEGVRGSAGLEAVDLGDVGVVELCQQLRFAFESGETLFVLGEGCGQDLDRHFALQARVGGAVDLPHAAFADLGGDLVGADSLADQGANPIRLPLAWG